MAPWNMDEDAACLKVLADFRKARQSGANFFIAETKRGLNASFTDRDFDSTTAGQKAVDEALNFNRDE